MAASSSDNNNTTMSNIETWAAFRTTFDNSWISEAFARDTEALTRALTKSITDGPDVHKNVSFTTTETYSSSLPVHSVSSSGGSDPEPEPETEAPSVSKRPPRNPVSAGKIAKRKSRASKRSPTTFITADPANFRQMVQQVTGVRFGSIPGPILKPEALRAGVGSGMATRLQGVGVGHGGGCMLPTLDTSAFLLDHHQQVVGPANVGGGSSGFGVGPTVGEGSGPGFDFDGFSCFPTLESWKVM